MIIGVFFGIRFFRMRGPKPVKPLPTKEISHPVAPQDASLEQQEIIDCDDTLVDSGKDLSDKERVALEKILKGYSTGKEKK